MTCIKIIVFKLSNTNIILNINFFEITSKMIIYNNRNQNINKLSHAYIIQNTYDILT